jgi:protocatechuate 3,4-dioxygenase beta subunit
MILAATLAAAAMAAAPQAWDLQIGPAGEPGTRLEVIGHVRRDRGSPGLGGMHVFAYHADSKGLYALPGHEKEGARLAGTAVTNQRGEFRIRTTMPGAYGGGPPHIHFEVWGNGVPRKAFVMNLMTAAKTEPDTGSVFDRAIARASAPPEGGFQLIRDAHGVLHGGYEIYLRWGMTIPGAK